MIDAFRKITDSQKNELFKKLESQTRSFKKGDKIAINIPSANFISIVLEGTIQIMRTDFNGDRQLSDVIRKDMVFGTHISFLNDHECDIIAKTDCTLLIIDYFNITNYANPHDPVFAQFSFNLFEITLNIIKDRNARIKLLSKKTIRNRLLEYFDIISNQMGSKSFQIPFSFTDLADYLAVDRSAMTREIKSLKDERFIVVKRRKITLLY